jgi:purine nucleoside permease
MHFPSFRLLAVLLLGALGLALPGRAAPTALPVLIVTTYETGRDTGDVPGELQYWAEREHLDTSIDVPGVDHPLLTNGRGLYAMVSGTTSRCALQLMALAADPRFDLRRTYVIVDGIAGGDPAEVSLASAAWITRVVDGNPAFEIDSREIPAAWPYGLVAFGAEEPGKGSLNVDNVPAAGASENGSGGVGTVAFTLNPKLAAWAFQLTKNVPLADDAAMRASRAKFTEFPSARRPPFVTLGFSLAGDRFWHGARMRQWARDWVRLYTRNTGDLAMADCEDAGVCLAMQRLGRMGKVDFNRLLVLRAACNFVMPPPGVTPAEGLFSDTVSESGGIAYLPALESCYRVGSVVSTELLRDWDKYRDRTP